MLNENIDLYRDLVEHLPDGVILHRQGRILFANQTAADILGAPSTAALKGKDVLELVHPDHRDAVIEAMRRTTLDSQTGFLEQKILRFDGTVAWVDVRVTATTFNGERAAVVVIRDATQRRQASEELRKAQDQLRDAIECIPNGFALWGADDRLVLRNNEFNNQYAEFGLPISVGMEYAQMSRAFLEQILKVPPDILEATAAARIAEHRAASGKREVKLSGDRYFRTEERPTSDGGIVTIRTDVTEMRRAEEALRASEEQFRLLFEMAPHGVVMHQGGVTLHANPAAARIMGVASPGDIIGRPISVFLPPEEAASAIQRARDVIDRKTSEVGVHEVMARHADGRQIILEARASPFMLRGEMAVLVHFQDVTERVQSREALRRAQQQLEDAIESMADGFALWGPDDRLIAFNEQFRKNCGDAKDVIVPGVTFESFFRAFIVRNRLCPPDEVEEQITRRLAQRSTPGGRFEIVGSGGEVYQVLERATRDRCIVCISIDITEIRCALQALRESEALHRLLFDAAPQGIVVSQDGVVVLANAAAARIHGFDSPQQFIGNAPHAFIHPDDLARVRRRGTGVMTVGEEGQVEDAQLRIVRSDGTIRHVVTGATRFTYRGAPALLIHQTDVTEQVKAHEEKQVLGAQLRRSEKMKSVGTLAEGIAHEFNNLLVPIIGLTELAIDSLPDGNASAAMLNQVLSAAQRSRELIKRIHAFGDSERACDTPLPVLVQDLIGATVGLIRPSVPPGIRINYHADPSCGPVAIQDGQLEQILFNLCSNAGDAIGEGPGEISIEVRPTHLASPRAATLQALRRGEYVVLSVRDTGCGMDAATLERIFDPFFTTKEVGRGTGLGLAVIHGLISACGGGITVASELGKGSEFCVYLPVASALSATPYVAA